ncbi:MAG: FAD-dependent oxidoreductase [Deltaproteobacteria bacterium]|nr:FAD-dependent oxidoreductase [Deltaproteobacteria bacterium]
MDPSYDDFDRVVSEYDVIVLGGGPAGLTAGIYLGRAKFKTLIIDTGTAGGQMILSYHVANYPGVEETSGASIAKTMRKQAQSFGCEILTQSKVAAMQLEGERKSVEVVGKGVFTSKVVIIASGGVPRTLGLASEKRLQGRGVSYCATCDGDFFTDMEIVAIGGGNSALEEAVALTAYASKVTIIHEFDHFQAEPWIVEEAKKNPKVHFLMHQEIQDFIGEKKLEKVVCTHKTSGEVTEVLAAGCFVFIGYVPKTDAFSGMVKLDERGQIITDERLATSVPGVFAAGDCRVKRYRQITTAVADGSIAAMAAIEELNQS